MAKRTSKAKVEKSIEAQLWDSANKLRGNIEASEYKHVVLSLIFLKYAGVRFERQHAMLVGKYGEVIAEMPQGYAKDNVFYLPEHCRWSYIMEHAKASNIAQIIDKALLDIDKEDDEKKKSDLKRSAKDVMSHIYRFPFEALDVFGWDIEHIDSATTNLLTKYAEQEAWIQESEAALGDLLNNDKDYKELKGKLDSADEKEKSLILANILKSIQLLIGEDDSTERKNWIGNLTLLDCGTNRMYQNKIFAIKRSIIHERVNRGVFVPVCTQNIFNKTYESCTKDNLRWDINDKKCYHKFILDQIETFKKKYHK